MIISKSVFVTCVSGDKILTAIMLPNTKHLNRNGVIEATNKFNDVIGIHNRRKITTGQLCFHDGVVKLYANSKHKEQKNIYLDYFDFQKAKKRFLKHDLVNEDGEPITPNKKQCEYLGSNLITHAWAALHKGHVVGLITYPYLKNTQSHDIAFFRYQAKARKALQTLGYVVSCDVVTIDGKLRIFNIHKEYERKGKIILNFTRELPVTSHLWTTE